MPSKKANTNVDPDDDDLDVPAAPARVEVRLQQPEQTPVLGEIQAGLGRLENLLTELTNSVKSILTIEAARPREKNPAVVTPAPPPAKARLRVAEDDEPEECAPALLEEKCPDCHGRILVTDNIWGCYCPHCGVAIRVDIDEDDEDADLTRPPARREDAKPRQGNPLVGAYGSDEELEQAERYQRERYQPSPPPRVGR